MPNIIRDTVLAEIKAGMSAADAARRYGLEPATVRQWVRRYSNSTAPSNKDTLSGGRDKKRDSVTKKRDKKRDKSDSVTKAASVTRAAEEVDRVVAAAVEDNDELTQKQKDFCRYYVRNPNATQAYLNAYGCSYDTANKNGPALLVNTGIKSEVKRLRAIKNEALGDFGADDLVELHLRIAFADSNDFYEFENKDVPVLDASGNPRYTIDPKTGEAAEIYRNINQVRLKSSSEVDGQLIRGISEGREGVKLQLADQQRSLAFLERWFEANPMDRHRRRYDNAMLDMRKQQLEAEHGTIDVGAAYNGLPASVIGKSYYDINRDIDNRKYTRYNFKGGRGGGRSSFCSLKLVDQIMLNPTFCGLVVRAVKDTMRDSVYAQVMWAIETLNLEHVFKCTVSPMEITRKDTGQKIYFRGADEPGKIKSIKSPNGMHIAIVWAEEKDQIPGGASWRNIIQSAFRGGDVGMEFNSYNTPISRKHYINQEESQSDPARIIHHGYYYDMPQEWLGQPFLDLAAHTKEVNERAYRHEYLGEATGTGANVFENVKIEALSDQFVQTFDKIYLGLDFGFYPDPAVFIACYYHKSSQHLYLFEEIKAYKTSNEDLTKLIGNKWRTTRIIADSQEPKSVQDIRKLGYNVAGAQKGKGSVEYGMKWLASLNAIVIDPSRCPLAANEFAAYEYARSKDGDIISGYVDKDNHSIDAVRYALEQIIRESRGGFMVA